ncbi:MAG: dihydropyrimidinase, partial [Oscillospiraceae bacterium]|nr:dihydropyrimidinase [Oscillospiraceae bacterium]
MLIQGGTLVLEDGVRQGDIRLEGERIVQVGGGMSPLPGEDVEDARGCWVVPGGVDAHTHFDMPAGAFHTADDFDTGT